MGSNAVGVCCDKTLSCKKRLDQLKADLATRESFSQREAVENVAIGYEIVLDLERDKRQIAELDDALRLKPLSPLQRKATKVFQKVAAYLVGHPGPDDGYRRFCVLYGRALLMGFTKDDFLKEHLKNCSVE